MLGDAGSKVRLRLLGQGLASVLWVMADIARHVCMYSVVVEFAVDVYQAAHCFSQSTNTPLHPFTQIVSTHSLSLSPFARLDVSCAPHHTPHSMFIHPRTQQEHAAAFDAAVSGLRYGSITINCPATAAFSVTALPWGAFPGGCMGRGPGFFGGWVGSGWGGGGTGAEQEGQGTPHWRVRRDLRF